MEALDAILTEQRRELARSGRVAFAFMTGFTLAALAFCALALATDAGMVRLPIAHEFMSDQAPEFAIGCCISAVAAGFRFWRVRDQRMKNMLAQAYVLEGDTDAAVTVLVGSSIAGVAALIAAIQILKP